MNIGIDARLYHESGVGRYIRNIIAKLSFIDTRNTYTLFVRSQTILPKLPSNWRPVVVDISWHSLKEQVVMPFIIQREKIDLVHFPYFNVPLWCPCPFVVTVHDLIINHFSTGRASTHVFPLYWLKRVAYQLIMNHAVRRAAAIIVPSKATEKELLCHYSVDRSCVSVITEGVLSSSIKAHKPPMLHNDDRFFLYVGNAYPHKNLETLIAAFVRFKQSSLVQARGVKLVFAGTSDFFYERLKIQVVSQPHAKSILFINGMTDAELAWSYRHALALVFPSFMEGFGLPAVEAMKEGCVVAASDIDALKEVCQDAALYFDPYDADAIAHIMNTIASPAFEQMRAVIVQKGKKRSMVFNWSSCARETLNIYGRISK